MNIYFTSDQHFNHANIIRYCNRPFDSVEEMNEHIIKQYNSVVRDEDVVYFLGDIGMGNITQIIKRLKGVKILVQGNHDKRGRKSYIKMGFSCVVEDLRLKVGKRLVNVSHVPYRKTISSFINELKLAFLDKRAKSLKQRIHRFKHRHKLIKKFNGDYTICGHVHTAWVTKDKNINIGVDMWNFKPVPIEKLVNLMGK